MKNILLAVVFVFLANFAFATTTTPNAEGTAQASIVAPLTLAHVGGSALNFGTWVQPTAAASVTIPTDADSVSVASGTVERIAASTVSRDHFTVTGASADVQYSVNLPSSIQIDKSSDHMTVSAFHASCESNCTASDLYIGGTLAIGANQAAGDYEGHYNLTITY